MAGKRDYYEILGVERTATLDEITKSYRKLAMKYHPDRNVGDNGAEEKFKEAAEAYDVLRDEAKRQRYDRYGHAGLEGMGGGPHFQDVRSVFDMFGDIFGDFFGGGQRGGPQGGRNVQVQVDIDLVEAYRGTRKTLTIPRDEPCTECDGSGARKGSKPAMCRRCQGRGVVVQAQGFFRVQQTCRACGGRGAVITDPCPTCQGNGKVRVRRTIEVAIPPGVDTGMRVRQPGQGEAGDPDAPPGDLLLAVRVREHQLFQREGTHLLCQVPVTFSQATLGAEIDIPTLAGKLKYPLPRGTQAGEVLRIHSRGMPDVHTGRNGDLLVQIVLDTPKNLTKRQEELFRELAELDKKEVSPTRKSFLEKVKEFFSGEADDNHKGNKEHKE